MVLKIRTFTPKSRIWPTESLTARRQLLAARIGEVRYSGNPDPVGLGIRTSDGGELKLLFRKKNRAARRFEAARFLADHVCSGQQDRWFPVTDAATVRQKLQRAFAAEFLCSIDSLRDYLGDEFYPAAFEDAADYFGISELAIKSHLANHKLIASATVEPPVIQ